MLTKSIDSFRTTSAASAPCRPHTGRTEQGFTLVEMMVALVLGLLVIGGVISVFIANQQSYRTNQALGEVQDGSRIAFEFMARDLRNAGLTGCGNAGRVGNVLNNGTVATAAPAWWANWANALVGYDSNIADPAVALGANVAQRVAGTSSMQVIGIEGAGYTVQTHNATAAPPTITLNDASANFQAGDALVVCDPDHAAIFQATGYGNAPPTITYNAANGIPGNCSTGLGFPTACGGAGTVYTFGRNAQIARLSAADWYVGNNPAGTTSLYRLGLTTAAAATTVAPGAQELVRNVTNMQIQYLENGNPTFVQAAGVVNWNNVTAVRVTLTIQGTDATAGTNAQAVSRAVTATINLRNRVP